MRKKKTLGQVIIEFTFCMIIVFLMIFSIMMIFRWTGLDLVFRRKAHEDSITIDVNHDYTEDDGLDGPGGQIAPHFYGSRDMNAVWAGSP